MPRDYAQVSVDDNETVATTRGTLSSSATAASSLRHQDSPVPHPPSSNWTEISNDNNDSDAFLSLSPTSFPSSQPQRHHSIHPSGMSPTARVLARLTNPLKSIVASVSSRTSRFTSSTAASTAAYSPLREGEGRAPSRHSNLDHSTATGGTHSPLGGSSSSSSSGPSSSSSSRVIMPRPAMDGVFANLSAKPEVESQKDNEQRPPTYESAVQDVTPPYYEMTVTPSVFGDEILVHGMPVGNIFQFLWNAAVAVSFQFIGVLLTYLLHNSHASKSGSMVGLGITLINFGIQMRGGLGAMLGYDTTEPGTGHAGEVTKPVVGGGSYMDDTGYIGDSDPYDDGTSAQGIDWLQSDMESHWVSLLLMIAGWLVIIKALAEYAYAKRTEMVISARPADERTLSARELREFMGGTI